MGQGFIPGTAQMAPASRVALNQQRGSRSQGRRRRKKSRAQGRARAPRRASRRASRGRKMKFGSPAWQKKYKVGRYAKGRR